ncbi:MAG: YgjV family protein [Treponema sp.]|jgi:hypothetical protein|nr:YgjV family protein [Treponema sp.]
MLFQIPAAGFFLEALGIAAALLIAASFCMTHIKSLRAVNLAGSLIFVVYGILIQSYAVTILNIFLCGVNVFYLVRIRSETGRMDLFDIMLVNPDENELVQRFVFFHKDDITRFFPSFNADPGTGSLKDAECCFILRETLPVSLVAYRRESDDRMKIILDYAIPAYRDFKNAKFFFENVINRLAAPGTVLNAAGEVPKHAAYLKKMGFTETGKEGGVVYFSRAV